MLFQKKITQNQSYAPVLKAAVDYYLVLKSIKEQTMNSDPLRMAPLDSYKLPKAIAERSMKNPDNPLAEITFVNGVCHRCQLAIPTLRFCHEMYGGKFIQQFGWYYNQQFLKLGIDGTVFLSYVCPYTDPLTEDHLKGVLVDNKISRN
ncbi:hypothetical protein [Neobacillus niacini]|uniref:hypothetical protein n=1 Tax=Neobacillus niacini TaxID=86668 RepID=UPI0007AC2496|nr:hypothetical protein [Neobacillus niacini]